MRTAIGTGVIRLLSKKFWRNLVETLKSRLGAKCFKEYVLGEEETGNLRTWKHKHIDKDVYQTQ